MGPLEDELKPETSDVSLSEKDDLYVENLLRTAREALGETNKLDCKNSLQRSLARQTRPYLDAHQIQDGQEVLLDRGKEKIRSDESMWDGLYIKVRGTGRWILVARGGRITRAHTSRAALLPAVVPQAIEASLSM